MADQTYQVLARKSRPQEFDHLIGQEAVVTALQNALKEGRVAQAYLFSGIRGVGKTSAARLFAKALNCEREPGGRPCNQCTTCREITAGSDLDVLEIDAATYSKVEQVRELAESLKYGPSRDRYKVVVLDEVHRLSRQAFDALLKIVEEPPPRLVFIFATTEADAVPATILSRCQEFHFRRVPPATVAKLLAKLCAEEQIEASEHALKLIARAGEGSVRDSVALLDQLATFGGKRIGDDAAAELIGGLDLALFARVLAAILAGDAPTVSAAAQEVEDAGWDPRQVYANFLGYVRDGLHLVLGGDDAALDLPEDERRALAGLAGPAGYETLLRLLHHLLGSETAVRRSDAGALALELAWLRAAELPKLLAVERLLAGEEPAPPAARPTTPPAPAGVPPASPAGRSAAAPRPAGAAVLTPPAAPPSPAAPTEPAAATTATPPPAPAAPVAAPGLASAGVERFREELVARKPLLAAQLDAAACHWRDGELELALPADDPLSANLHKPANRELLDAAVVAAFGAGARWRIVARAATAAEADDAAVRARRTRAAEQQAAADPRVQAVLEIFGGRIAGVDEAPPPSEEPG